MKFVTFFVDSRFGKFVSLWILISWHGKSNSRSDLNYLKDEFPSCRVYLKYEQNRNCILLPCFGWLDA